MPIPKKLITNESGQAKDCQALYAQGGVFCITSRILITDDLLTNVVTANEIAGMLVYRADQVMDESTETFILRIFHSQKQTQCSGSVKGFSKSHENLLSGFAKVPRWTKSSRHCGSKVVLVSPLSRVKNFVSINSVLAHFVVVAMCDKVMGWMTDDLVTAAWCATEECQQRRLLQ